VLNALVAYSKARLDSEPGFKARELRWRIDLAADGRFLNVQPLGDAKRGENQPRCPDMHSMNSGGRAHFLVETAQTAILLFKAHEDPKKIFTAEERHRFFVLLLEEAAKSVQQLAPLVELLASAHLLAEVRQALAAHKVKPSDWIGWQVDGVDPRLDSDVQAWWREWRRRDLGGPGQDAIGDANRVSNPAKDNPMVCLLTGTSTAPLATHPKITGLSGVGGLAMGDVLVGFDKAAFGSYGLDQSANAAMTAEAVQNYVDGLNDLIKTRSRKLSNTLVVHWFKERVEPQDDPLAFLYGMDPEGTESAALAEMRRLLESVRTGQRADLGNNRYYALTLSGASGRVMVRDWMEGKFEDLVQHVEAWFADLAIVARDGKGHAPNPKFLAVCGALVRDLKDLPAPTTATLWRVAVQGLSIPQPLMTQALARFRADIVARDQPAFNHARIGLIRAYFVRKLLGGDSNMTAYLNPAHPEPAYHCGRLLAVLADLQRAALGDVGAGVVQRYYAAFSQTPGLVLGRLISNARNHRGKLESGLAWWYDQRIAEVMSQLQDRAPRILDLEGQGLFALGYYQQLAAPRTGNKPGEVTESTPELKETK